MDDKYEFDKDNEFPRLKDEQPVAICVPLKPLHEELRSQFSLILSDTIGKTALQNASLPIHNIHLFAPGVFTNDFITSRQNHGPSVYDFNTWAYSNHSHLSILPLAPALVAPSRTVGEWRHHVAHSGYTLPVKYGTVDARLLYRLTEHQSSSSAFFAPYLMGNR